MRWECVMTLLVLVVLLSCPMPVQIPLIDRRGVEPGPSRFERRRCHEEAWTLPLAGTPRSHPDLWNTAVGDSISVGSTSTGYLVNGVALPADGEHHSVILEHRSRGTNWGTSEMINLIMGAAAEVAKRYPGSKLPVGNISKRGGGDLPWSISHNAGRDVDFGFYLVDEAGNQVMTPSMFPLLPPDGTMEYEGQTLRFDPARNWALVEALLSSSEAQVQYIFCADFLIKLMFEHALASGESAKKLSSLKRVLRQPRGTLPHDDHMHVRIKCDPKDVAEGCRDIVHGVEVVPYSNPSWRKRVKDAVRILRRGPAPRSAQAMKMLSLLRAPETVKLAWRVLPKCDEPLCLEALRALVGAAAAPRVHLLVRFIKRSRDPESVELAFRLLRRASPRYARKIVPLLADQRKLVKPFFHLERELVVRREACLAVGWLGNWAAGEKLAKLLGDEEEEVRQAALWALRAIVAAEAWPDELVDAPVEQPVALWKNWVKRHRSAKVNLASTLKSLGYRVNHLGREDSLELVRAIRDRDYVSLNAQRVLSTLYKSRIPLNLSDKETTQRLWKRVVRRR